MPDLTPRYGLKKPVQDGSETADLRVWVGENADLIDAAIGQVQDSADAAAQAATTAQQTATAAQQAASAAQAAADTAQDTADQALAAAGVAHSTANAAQQAAAAAQNAANTANQAITNHANAAAPHSGHAKTGSANTFSQRQTFQDGIQDGNANSDVSYIYSLGIPMHTRSKVATAWSAKGTPTKIEIRNGAAVLATITLTLNAKEKPVKAIAVFNKPGGGKVTVDVTQSFEGDTKFLSRTRTVTQT